jgi:hypothetical protein
MTSKSPARSAMASVSSAHAAFGSARLRAKPLCARPDRVELSPRLRIPAREHRHVMSNLDQLVDQPGYHTLGPTIKLRGNALGSGASWAIRIG